MTRHDSSLAEWGKESCIILRLCFHLPQCLVFASLHFRWVKQETEISRESQEADTRPKLDLGFKEGQTIKLNIGVRSEVDSASFSGYASGDCSSLVLPFIQNMTTKKGGVAKPRVSGSGGLSLLPPPPGGKIAVPPIPPPSSTAIANQVTPPPVLKSSNASSAGKH